MPGIYKIVSKDDSDKFHIIGIVNISAYWDKFGEDELEYSLIRECNKIDLRRLEKHFNDKIKPPTKKRPVIEVANIEPVVEEAVIKPKRTRKKKDESGEQLS